MCHKSSLRLLWFGFALSVLAAGAQAETKLVRVGFFEGGPYQTHADFRNAFRDQLPALLPTGTDAVFPADGFFSAEWNRTKSKQMARDIVARNNLDLIVTTGPWTVEDLLEAGYDRPIVAAVRFDPVAEGLVGANGRPIVDHLTVRVRPHKVESDLFYLAGLVKPDTVGVLYFPSGSEAPAALGSMRVIGRRFGFEILTAEGYDTDGAFAYFKAYRQLSRSADAVYLLPLWGCDGDKIRNFYQMLERDGKPALSSEGQHHVSRGAMASGSAEPALVEAHLQAWKAMRIILGTVPADLPTVLDDSPDLMLNDQVARSTGVAVPSTRRYDLAVVEGPAEDNVERLTVVDAVGVALHQNPGLQATYQTLEAAEKAASEARSVYYPQIEMVGSAAYHDDNSVNNDSRYDNTRLRARLSLRQELFALDAIKDIRTAALRRDGSKIDQKQASLDLELAVNLAFIDLVEAEQLRLVTQAYRQQTGEGLQLAQLRLSLDEAPPVDVWRAEQEWMFALQAVRAAECERQVARVLLNTLLGRPGDYVFVIDWRHFSGAQFQKEESLIEQLTMTSASREELMKRLENLAGVNSPEVESSNLEIAVRKSELSSAGAEFWPRIGFIADFGLTDELAERVGFDEANPSWSVGAEIRLPLFMGGRRIQERNRRRVLLDEGMYRKDQVSQQTQAEVRISIENALSRASESVPAARAAELAGQIYPDVLARYAHGAERIVDLIDAARNNSDASRNAINAQAEYYRATASLIRKIGISAYELGRSASEELLRQMTASTTESTN